MTATLLLGLLLLSVSPVLMWARYGRSWGTRPFGVLVVMAVIYHGLSELVVRLTAAQGLVTYRVSDVWIDKGVLVAGACLLAATTGYIAASPRGIKPVTSADRPALARAFDPKLTGLLAVPLFLATAAGNGYNAGRTLTGEGVSAQGLAAQFFFILTVATAFGVLLRRPGAFVLVIGSQSAVIALAGQRLEIFVGAVLLCLLAARTGLTPRRRQVVAVAAIACLLAVGIGAVRNSIGRQLFYSDSGVSARIEAIGTGITHPSLGGSDNDGNPAQQAGLRLNSAYWAGAVERGLDARGHGVGTDPFEVSVVTAVPSAVYPGKIAFLAEHGVSEKAQIRSELGMAGSDYLPGHVALYLGAVGLIGTLTFNLFFGAVLGFLDRRVLTSTGVAALAGYLVLVQAALFFEKGTGYYFIAARGYIVLLFGLWIWGKVRPRLRRRHVEDEQTAALATASRRLS